MIPRYLTHFDRHENGAFNNLYEKIDSAIWDVLIPPIAGDYPA